MAFEIARVHSAISSHLEPAIVEGPISSQRRRLSLELNSGLRGVLSQEPIQAFPSPRTWHATRGACTPEPYAASEASSSESGDLDSDAGAEIAEWMAQSCILDDDLHTPGQRPLPMSFDHLSIRTRVSPPVSTLSNGSLLGPRSSGGSSAVSWSSACSSESSQGASPTSVLGEAGLAEWDLLFAAAGEIQKLAREHDSRGVPHTKRMEQLLGRTQSVPVKAGKAAYGGIPPAGLMRTHSADSAPSPLGSHLAQGRRHSSKKSSSSSSSSSSSNRSAPGQGRMGNGASPQKAKVPRGVGEARRRDGLAVVEVGKEGGLATVTLGAVSKDQANGTGVFLPRAAAAAAVVEEKPSKKVAKPTTVVLPARLVEALGLDVDQENNVVFSRQMAASQWRTASGRASAPLPPVMKVAPEEALASRPRVGNGNGAGKEKSASSPARPKGRGQRSGLKGLEASMEY